jgi:hypothetical protein
MLSKDYYDDPTTDVEDEDEEILDYYYNPKTDEDFRDKYKKVIKKGDKVIEKQFRYGY